MFFTEQFQCYLYLFLFGLLKPCLFCGNFWLIFYNFFNFYHKERFISLVNVKQYKLKTILYLTLLGIADGVGGWIKRGIDPSIFSRKLMSACKEFVKSESFSPQYPTQVLAVGYRNVLNDRSNPIGKFLLVILLLRFMLLLLSGCVFNSSGLCKMF